MNTSRKICLFLMFMAMTGCEGEIEVNDMKVSDMKIDRNLESIQDNNLEALMTKRVFFGHASVGANIITGIEEIRKNSDRFGQIAIQELRNVDDAEKPGIYHASIGKNGNPDSKMNAFKDRLFENNFGEKLDVAFFKFCYVDFDDEEADVRKVFGDYVMTVESIKTKFPHLKIVHVTTPLYAHRLGLKGFIKTLLFYPDIGNARRNQYNRLLITRYGETDAIYDLASIESVNPKGKRVSFQQDGESYYALAKEYTDDGGHLNEIGRYYAAKGLLEVLAKLSTPSK